MICIGTERHSFMIGPCFKRFAYFKRGDGWIIACLFWVHFSWCRKGQEIPE